MKIQTKFIGFVGILHTVALVLSYFVFKEDLPLFLVAEVFILISIALCFQLYGDLIKPIKLLMQGTDAIKDKDFSVKFRETGKFEMDQLIEVYNRMIEELRTERLKQEEQHLFLEKLVHNSPTGILILDFDEGIQQINPRAKQLLDLGDDELQIAINRRENGGLAQSSQRNTLDFTSSAALGGLTSASSAVKFHPILKQIHSLETGTSKTIAITPLKTLKIHKSNFIDRGFPRQFVMLEELTEELLTAEKQAYGKIIRMMAHEVNNTIGPVNSILQSAINRQPEEDLKEAFQVAMDRNQNLNHFMRNFADLVRLPEPNKKPIDLHKLLYSIAKLMEQKAIEKHIRFEFYLSDAPFIIQADEHQMEQALINMVKNAMEAIDQQGSITFETNPTTRRFSITDTGSGISDEDSALLFSPFFSTKKDGQGIGLTLIREILSGHGFRFALETVEKGKTVFWVEVK